MSAHVISNFASKLAAATSFDDLETQAPVATAKPTTLVKTNLITNFTDNMHSEDAPRLLSIVINSLTAVAVNNVIRHIQGVRRGYIAADEVHHIDERNEADEHARGEDLENYVTALQGFNIKDKPMKIAQVCDGIRFSLYQRMHAFGEFADDKHLYFAAPVVIGRPINYNQPMSVETFLDFRIQMADRIDENLVRIHAKRIRAAEAIVRQAFADEAAKSKAMLIDLRPHVLSEMNSFEDVYDDAAFTLLDIETQVAIATKISEKLDRLYMQLIPRAVRSLNVASQLDRVQEYHEYVKQWLLDNDAELQQAMAMRGAGNML